VELSLSGKLRKFTKRQFGDKTGRDMSNVYVVKDGKTEPMTVVHVKNEDKELQTILNNNFKL
jgi:hypothetical protein